MIRQHTRNRAAMEIDDIQREFKRALAKHDVDALKDLQHKLNFLILESRPKGGDPREVCHEKVVTT